MQKIMYNQFFCVLSCNTNEKMSVKNMFIVNSLIDYFGGIIKSKMDPTNKNKTI